MDGNYHDNCGICFQKEGKIIKLNGQSLAIGLFLRLTELIFCDIV